MFSRVWPRNCPILVHVLTLALDTSSLVGSLAVLRDHTLLGVISTSSDENYSSRMFRHLEFLLRDLALNFADLFSVAAGPGSFTGLRVGLTAAKAWSEVYRKPVVGVSALEAVAAQSFPLDPSRPEFVIPILDARRSQLYCAFYLRTGSQLKLDGAEVVLSPDELFAEIQKRCANSKAVIATSDPQLISAALSRFENSASSPSALSIILQTVSGVLAPSIGKLAIASAQQHLQSRAERTVLLVISSRGPQH